MKLHEEDQILFDEISKHLDEAVKTITGMPGVDSRLDRIFKRKKYAFAIKYYLDWRRKNPGMTGFEAMKAAAKHTGLDFRNLNRVFHKAIDKGQLPKDLALDVRYENVNVGLERSKKFSPKVTADEKGIKSVKTETKHKILSYDDFMSSDDKYNHVWQVKFMRGRNLQSRTVKTVEKSEKEALANFKKSRDGRGAKDVKISYLKKNTKWKKK